jgi:hypothetical protein
MELELRPDVQRRAAAHAAEAGRNVKEYLEGLIERNLPEGPGTTLVSRSEKKGRNFTPIQLSFSLWLRGFVNAALSINIIISIMCLFGLGVAFFSKNRMSEQLLSGLVTLSLGLATFSQVGAAAIALLSGLRYVYARFRLKGTAMAIIAAAAYGALGSYLVNLLLKEDLKPLLGITAAFVLTLISGVVATWGIRNSDPQKYLRPKPLRKLTLDDLISWRWNQNLYEDVKEVYSASKAAAAALKGSSEVTHTALPTDIGGDFKAWNDAAKLFITILTGLTIISSLFTDGKGVWDLAFRIVMLLILLVPALGCAYMEGFRRQCERYWQAIDKAQAGE